MQGFVFDGFDNGNIFITNPHSPLHSPEIKTLVYIIKYFPHIITDVSEESILDRAQSSALSKAILITQVIAFCMNCASRLLQHLPLSLLEISTAAHAFCTLVTYIVWWSKPLNVAAPTVLRGKESREVFALLTCQNSEYDKALALARTMAAGTSSTIPEGENQKIIMAATALQHLLPNPEKPPPSYLALCSNNAVLPGHVNGTPDSEDYNTRTIIVSVSCLFYGLIHLLAFSDQFPTPLERLLWLVSSVVVMCSGLVMSLLVRLMDMNNTILSNTSGITILSLLPVYIFASGFLLGESFRQLFFLDPAVYQLPSWSNYWPHFS